MESPSTRPLEETAANSSARRRLPFSALLVLSLLIALARTHTYHEPLERDITAYAVIAHELLQGRQMYSQLWDHKPPAVHLTYALAELAAGYGYAAVYLLGITAAIVTLIGVYKAASALGGLVAGLWAAAFWTAMSGDLYLRANQPNTEVFMNASVVWALALLLGADRHSFSLKHAILVGVLFALGSLYKQVVVAYAGLLCLAHLAFPPQDMRGRRPAAGHVAVIAAIGIAAWATLAGYFAATNRFGDFYDAVFAFNRSYTGSIWTNLWNSLDLSRLFHPELRTISLLLSVISVAGIVLAAMVGSISRRCRVLLVASVVATQLATAMPGKFFGHYYQLWLPLLAVCGGLGIVTVRRLLEKRSADTKKDERATEVLERKGTTERRYRGPVYWAHVVGAVVLGLLLWLEIPLYGLSAEEWSRRKYGEIFVDSRNMGREIGLLLQPDETFFEWGNETGLYFDSRRRPASGVMILYALSNKETADRVTERLVADLEREQPELLVVHKPEFLLNLKDHPALEWFGTRFEKFPGGNDRGRFALFIRRGGALEMRLMAQGKT